MIVHVVIRPGLPPMDRATLEDDVVAALGAGAEATGGGTLMDRDGTLVESDFDVEVPDGSDEDQLIATVQAVLGRVTFLAPSTFTVEVFEGDLEWDEDDDEPAN